MSRAPIEGQRRARGRSSTQSLKTTPRDFTNKQVENRLSGDHLDEYVCARDHNAPETLDGDAEGSRTRCLSSAALLRPYKHPARVQRKRRPRSAAQTESRSRESIPSTLEASAAKFEQNSLPFFISRFCSSFFVPHPPLYISGPIADWLDSARLRSERETKNQWEKKKSLLLYSQLACFCFSKSLLASRAPSCAPQSFEF